MMVGCEHFLEKELCGHNSSSCTRSGPSRGAGLLVARHNCHAVHALSARQDRGAELEGLDEADDGAAAGPANDGEEVSSTGKFPWSATDRDYDYEELLGEERVGGAAQGWLWTRPAPSVYAY